MPERLEVVRTELLEKLGTALPADSYFTAASPVEIKGYKNIVKLLDWLFRHNISVKSEKSCHNGRIYLLESCPFSSDYKDGADAFQFASGAIHAGWKMIFRHDWGKSDRR
ncbi:MAG: hypothetical protein Q8N94_02415 [Methanoregula sp.]|nr:hypothetical protein [Methanoregula sp.]